MECFSEFQNNGGLDQHVLPHISTVRHIAIVLFNGFPLPEVASIAEVFQSANSLAENGEFDATRYEVSLLSASGGRVVSSSSVFVWTESVEVRRHADSFRALFIAGGAGVRSTLRDERLITWLRRACPRSEFVHTIDEGGLLREAAGFAHSTSGRKHADRIGDVTLKLLGATPSNSAMSPMRTAL
ncbi:AraC family transcriptional regulator, partial [Paraburkholderia sp. 5N]|nr:AraC family transcriptional regulator [Paraburkholderia elongata]